MSFYQGRAYSILHPTDFSETSEIAFAHALAIAIKNKADLTILHVEADKHKEMNWHEFPAIRETLERWGQMEPGSRRSDISAKLGIQVDKRIAVGSNPVNAVVELSNMDSFDLLVMGTSGTNNFLIEPPASLKISQQTRLPTLFIVEGARSCVDLTTGQASLRKVVLAIDHQPNARPGLARICTMVHNLAIENPEVHLLYVGNENQFPDIDLPADSEITWSKVSRTGTPSTEITGYAKEVNADLIVMVTSGKRSLWDMLTGSTVQNVLKNAPCPVFTLPVE
jgi:nucleotide-binding universal stress UspA family protein